MPLDVAEIVGDRSDVERAHPDAVPPGEIAEVNAPVPEPPDAVNVSACEYGYEREVMFDVTLTKAWVALLT